MGRFSEVSKGWKGHTFKRDYFKRACTDFQGLVTEIFSRKYEESLRWEINLTDVNCNVYYYLRLLVFVMKPTAISRYQKP